MAQKRRVDQTKLIAEAALSLAGEKGWDRLAFQDIAKKAKVGVMAIEARFSDSWDILKWVLKKLEKDTQDAVEGYLGGAWRDNLMEILMMRFELAQKHRDAYAAIPRSVLRDPAAARRFAPGFCRTMERMLKLAGLPESRCQPPFVAAFGAIYLSIVDAWSRDDTPDLSRTMAAVDRRLGHFEAVIGCLQCKRKS